MTHPEKLREELYNILNAFHFESGGHKPNDFRPTLDSIAALIDKARKEAVEAYVTTYNAKVEKDETVGEGINEYWSGILLREMFPTPK